MSYNIYVYLVYIHYIHTFTYVRISTCKMSTKQLSVYTTPSLKCVVDPSETNYSFEILPSEYQNPRPEKGQYEVEYVVTDRVSPDRYLQTS